MVLCKYREVIDDSLGCGDQAGLALRAIGAIVVGVGGIEAKTIYDLSLEVLVSEVDALVNKGNLRARSGVASIPNRTHLNRVKSWLGNICTRRRREANDRESGHG